jgi:hypothetical protein
MCNYTGWNRIRQTNVTWTVSYRSCARYKMVVVLARGPNLIFYVYVQNPLISKFLIGLFYHLRNFVGVFRHTLYILHK